MLGFSYFSANNINRYKKQPNTIIYDNIVFRSGDNKKFYKDKIFEEDEDIIIVLEGVLLNKKHLINKYPQKNYFNTIKYLYYNNGKDFFKEFKGAFSGVIYDKKSKRTLVFTNQFADKQVFYGQLNDITIIANDMSEVVKYLKENNIKYYPNKEALYSLLTYGFVVEELTIIEGIKKLLPGNYLDINNNSIEKGIYFDINALGNNYCGDFNEEKTIDRLDTLFREAVKLEMDKDIEYGSEYHLMALSGGLDSRMTTWVANDLGYKNIINYNFGKANYLDEKIAKSISKDLGTGFIFKGLDDSNFMKKIDESVLLNFGTACYSTTAHQNDIYKFINFDKFGLIHSGQLGDIVVGTFSSLPEHQKAHKEQGMYSKILLDKVNFIDSNKYRNEEMFKLNIRGISNLNPHSCIQHYTEIISPFLDVDFFEFCLNIEPKYRYKHNLYYKWLEIKYPKAIEYIYEREKCRPTSNTLIMEINIFKRRLRGFIERKLNNNIMKENMNPFDYWYTTNKDTREFMDSYYKENIGKIDFDLELSKDIKKMYEKASAREKMQVLTVLSIYNNYFE